MAALFPDNAGVREALVQWHLRPGDPAGAEAVLRAPPPRDPATRPRAGAWCSSCSRPAGAATPPAPSSTGCRRRPPTRCPFRRARAGLDFAEGRTGTARSPRCAALLDGAAPSDATRELQVALAEMLAATGDAAGARALVDGGARGRPRPGGGAEAARPARHRRRPARARRSRTCAPRSTQAPARPRDHDHHGAGPRARGRARARRRAAGARGRGLAARRRRNRCATPAS